MKSILVSDFTPHRLAFFRSGEAHPLLTQSAAPNTRPFIHPWRTPDNKSDLTENQPAHHPWQHGLYTGLNGVNGVGFWTEGLLTKNAPLDGTFHPSPLTPPILDGASARWEVETHWHGPDQSALLHETQRWALRDNGSSTVLDLSWTLEAATDLTFEKSTYGGLFLRMPWRVGIPAALLTSEGVTEQHKADQQCARWVAVSLQLATAAEATAGVAFFDYPQNPGHPSPWRVDGELGMAPSRCIAGAWQLARGTKTVSRYRLVSFSGGLDAVLLTKLWNEYEKTHD